MSGWEAFGYGILGAAALIVGLGALYDLLRWLGRWGP